MVSADDETEVTSKPIKEISGHNVRRISPAQQALHSLRAKVDARLLVSLAQLLFCLQVAYNLQIHSLIVCFSQQQSTLSLDTCV